MTSQIIRKGRGTLVSRLGQFDSVPFKRLTGHYSASITSWPDLCLDRVACHQTWPFIVVYNCTGAIAVSKLGTRYVCLALEWFQEIPQQKIQLSISVSRCDSRLFRVVAMISSVLLKEQLCGTNLKSKYGNDKDTRYVDKRFTGWLSYTMHYVSPTHRNV